MPDVAARPSLIGLAGALALSALIVAGSHAFTYFDPAVTGYAVATVVAAGAMTWRFAVWLLRPSTRLFWQRGWQLLRDGRSRRHGAAIPGIVLKLATQSFIWQRARLRWVMHAALAWGCTVAFAIALPLVFGWLHFVALPGGDYRLMLFGVPTVSFPVHSLVGFFLFNGLNLAAALVLLGCAIAFWLRVTDRGARSYHQAVRDYLPLVTLATVSLTGLALTADAHWLGGRFYLTAAVAHELAVVFLLLYFPFSKLFHAVQRPAAIGVELYLRAARDQGYQACSACRRPFGFTMHVADVQRVLAEMGASFRSPGGSRWQDLCPVCRRLERAKRFQAMAQDKWV